MLSPQEWVDWALEQGERSPLLCDINSTAAAMDFIRRGQEAGLKPRVGVDFQYRQQRYFVALANNQADFFQINQELSRVLRNEEPRAEALDCPLIFPWQLAPKRALRTNEFLGILPQDRNRLQIIGAQLPQDKLVPLYFNRFRNKRDYNTHRLLRAVGENTLLSKLAKNQQAAPQWGLLTEWELQAQLPNINPKVQHQLAESSLSFEFKNYALNLNKRFYGANQSEDRALIQRLCRENLSKRYPKVNRTVKERLQKELNIIEQKGYFSYFLINWDIVQYARRKNYFYVGRGSGANSMVAYLLGITDVDPIALDLYFERFMNLSRKQPPDFDIDFSWRDREDVTAHIFRRYPKAALLGSHTTFKYRAIVRELGKVLGLPASDIEDLSAARKSRFNPGKFDEMQELVLRYGQRIEGFPHHHTIHASGILIPERSVHNYSASFIPPKGFPTTQFDMYIAEDVGLHKFDILGQRGLAKIKEAVELVKSRYPEQKDLDIHQVEPFYRDPKIKELLKTGQTMACFYIESPAMRGLLKKLRADNYLGLVAASSIIRPGVSQSGMMQEYIRRYREPERRQYIHPKMAEILAETYGVMVYQEDVLKVAHYFAGLSLEEADVLRRGMSWKFREKNQFNTIKERFFENCRELGYREEISQEVWRQIESFGNYAFAKGHSASYAVESYQSLFLKAYYPLEYMVATVNNGGGFYSVETYLNEARLLGAQVEAPCVNLGGQETRLIGKDRIVLGFQHLKDLEVQSIHHLLEAREDEGPFKSFAEFLERVPISLEQLLLLIRIDAFRCLESDRKKLLWEAHFKLGKSKKTAPVADLFRQSQPKFKLPELEAGDHEKAFDQIELLGFSLSSPFSLLAEKPTQICAARELPQKVGQTVRLCGYLIHVKNLTTRGQKAQHMMFGTFLDQAGDFIDTVHFPQAAQAFPFKGKGIYLIQGRVIEEYDFISVDVAYLERLAYVNFT